MDSRPMPLPWIAALALALVGCATSPEPTELEWSVGDDGRADSAEEVRSLAIAAGYFPGGDVLAFDGSSSGAARFADSLAENHLNAVVLDIKEGEGRIFFETDVDPQLWEEGHPLEESIRRNTAESAADLPRLVEVFHDRGLQVIVRQVLFKDAAFVRSNPECAIRDSVTGSPWGSTRQWVNPWSQDAVEYNIEIALRALASGADEVQFDYIRFPDQGTGDQSRMTFPERPDGARRCDAITAFLARAWEEIHAVYPDARIGVDVFGYVANGRNYCDAIGQHIGDLAPYIDVIWPMQYPSHWAWSRNGVPQASFGTTHPETVPTTVYEVTTRNLRQQLGSEGERVLIVPWVQAFYIGRFGGVTMQAPSSSYPLSEYVVDEIDGIVRGGGNGFALWGYGSSQDTAVRAIGRATE